ncbi:MAG: hypothetical protein HY744_06060 [Deltaproteobacteria bacterium]|nr:hypothetical protein [Deltaproteobacteria bacterium]
MSHEWYARQFGDREHFAVSFSFGRDPHSLGDAPVDAGWGGLSMWVRGRCLTRNVSGEGDVCDEVRWALTGILHWLTEVAVRLINEEPFPAETSKQHVADGCDWFNAAEIPLLSLSEGEEDAWFLRRSDWRQHHALRRAALDAALPNVVIRRLGDCLEVSWDNLTWAAPRPHLSFVEQRGVELVDAAQAASDLRAALSDATTALADRYPLPELADLAAAASGAPAAIDDWRWLVHQETARVIDEELVDLRDDLRRLAQASRRGAYVPHTAETLVLRQARVVSADEISALVDLARCAAPEPMADAICGLVRPSRASSVEPWRDGYEQARQVRDALEWGDEPIDDLGAWLTANRVSVVRRGLCSSIDLVATRTDDLRGSMALNSAASSALRREIAQAAAFGHLLFDFTSTAVDGPWEHWPSAARARAFAAMLLLPDEGVRSVLPRGRAIDASDLRRVMGRFGTGPYATTYHLHNRGFIGSDERRDELLRQMLA